ncbi:hypothetical protein [Brevibacillus fulvus]|uniref:Uncharacterized protein n=1 Tax=Brevibacillus fulvus TaxID=1125967 RepID=A0A939BRD9_9BACL|nr:hypothetical protein [Brevibacillus fulvus]MBM7589368.1 hypothetical protein [Brevibacillus fulvus]
MARRELPERTRVSPEFQEWLRSNQVSRRQLRRNPELFHTYYEQWQRTVAKPKSNRRSLSLFSKLSRVDLNQVSNHLSKASEVIGMIQNFKGIFGSGGRPHDFD